jgi:hypothetical protein
LCLLHLLPLPTFSFLPPSLFSHYPAIFVLSQGRTLPWKSIRRDV